MRLDLTLLALLALSACLGITAWFASWPTAATTHLILAVGIFPLIVAAMIYFTPVLTRSGSVPWKINGLPLLAMVSGGFACYAILQDRSMIILAAPLAMMTVLLLLLWVRKRIYQTLGSPHPGLAWYVAALLCLMLGLLVMVLTHWFPEWWPTLRHLHRSLNLLGFVAITAVGTLQVLLPTVGGYADPLAAQRLRFDLKYAVLGTLLVALGAALQEWPMAVGLMAVGSMAVGSMAVGTLLWGWVLGRLMLSLLGHFQRIWRAPGAAFSLLAAPIGLGLTLLHGLTQEGVLSLPLFFTLFLFPLITGAMAHLLPLWWWPGRQTNKRVWAQNYLGEGAWLRVAAFCLGGAALQHEQKWALYLIGIALLLFLGQVIWAFSSPTLLKQHH